MCAGGYVMPSVSEPGYFCTNGMSESRHDSPFANSGLVVTIEPARNRQQPSAGRRSLPAAVRAARVPGGGQVVQGADPVGPRFPRRAGRAAARFPPAIAGATGPIDLGLLLPEPVVEALLTGLPLMDRRFGGRFLRDATLTGPESRGSSPVRIIRDPASRQSPAVAGLYPCGEGAGYAGGIVSAAVDGVRTARAIVAEYANA